MPVTRGRIPHSGLSKAAETWELAVGSMKSECWAGTSNVSKELSEMAAAYLSSGFT